MMRTPAWWQSRGLVSTLLLPFACLYGLGNALDRRLTTPKRAPLPVIGIGNVTAGGAGKTPTAIALAQLLQAMGETPHIISRGYGGRQRTAHAVDPAQDSAVEVGDEALLLARVAPAWVGTDRWMSACLAKQAGATLVIADDAMQHYALHQDITLLVVDAAYGFGNQRLLPAGPLREPLAVALARADLAVVIGGDAPPALAPLVPSIIRAEIQPVGNVNFLAQAQWLAFAGIAHPEKFFATLHRLQAAVVATQRFADHAPFTASTIAQLRQQAADKNLQLITTEKDYVRIPPHLRDGIATLPIVLHWEDTLQLKQSLATRLTMLRT